MRGDLDWLTERSPIEELVHKVALLLSRANARYFAGQAADSILYVP